MQEPDSSIFLLEYSYWSPAAKKKVVYALLGNHVVSNNHMSDIKKTKWTLPWEVEIRATRFLHPTLQFKNTN